LILFQAASPMVMVPDGSAARVFILDPHGNVLARSGGFSTGWRIQIHDASLQWEGEHGFPCLKIATSWFMGADIRARYYAILDDWSIALVRPEDSEGRLQNAYFDDFPAVERNADEWEAWLGSANQGEVLAALAWIGGSPKTRPTPAEPGELKSFEQIRDLRSRARVWAALEELQKSSDAWVQEAATAAWQMIECQE
jgi:hypothetical protein